MSTYNINLPAATSFGISNFYFQTNSNDNNAVQNDVTKPVTNQDNSFSFVQNVLQTLQEVTAANQDTATTETSNANPIGALQVFLYDLNQALTQTQPPQTETAEVVDDATSTLSSEINAAYSNPETNLQSLIASLDNETQQNATLKTDFTNLMQSLGSNTSVTLQDFLTKLAVNVGNGDVLQNNLGNFFSATA